LRAIEGQTDLIIRTPLELLPLWGDSLLKGLKKKRGKRGKKWTFLIQVERKVETN